MLPLSRLSRTSKRDSNMRSSWSSSEHQSIRKVTLGAVTVLGVFMIVIAMRSLLPVSDAATSYNNGNSSWRFRLHGGKSKEQLELEAIPSSKVTVENTVFPPANLPSHFDIGVVADLDKKSKVEEEGKVKFYSLFKRGRLTRTETPSSKLDSYSVEWKEGEQFFTKMNEGGRGFELSELKWFNGKLYTVDDRTGIIFQLHNFRGSGMNVMRADPKNIVMEGDGDNEKGQKHEWATVKDGVMYVGSIGKEYTNANGEIVNNHNFWVAKVSRDGSITHVNWTENYRRMRQALGCTYPGYLIHEAIEWSPEHRKWFVLPRRVSTDPYNDMTDEKKGSNKMLVANEDFTDIDVREVIFDQSEEAHPERGFSSFTFIPSTHDTVIAALRSMEDEEAGKQSTFITVFNIDGVVLMPEQEIGPQKYEGIELLNDWTPRENPVDLEHQ